MNNTKLILIPIVIIFLIGFTTASFGVSFPSKISLTPGQIYEGTISLQNVLEPATDETIQIIVEKGQEYIELQENQIEIKAGEIKDISIKVTAPKKSSVDNYQVQLLFQPIEKSPGQEGAVNIVLALRKSFEIEVLQNKNSKATQIIILIVLLIIIGILIKSLVKVLKNKK